MLDRWHFLVGSEERLRPIWRSYWLDPVREVSGQLSAPDHDNDRTGGVGPGSAAESDANNGTTTSGYLIGHNALFSSSTARDTGGWCLPTSASTPSPLSTTSGFSLRKILKLKERLISRYGRSGIVERPLASGGLVLLGHGNYLLERLGVPNGQVRQHLPVDLNVGVLQPVD